MAPVNCGQGFAFRLAVAGSFWRAARRRDKVPAELLALSAYDGLCSTPRVLRRNRENPRAH